MDERGAAGEREGVDGFVIDQRESEWESGVARLRRRRQPLADTADIVLQLLVGNCLVLLADFGRGLLAELDILLL